MQKVLVVDDSCSMRAALRWIINAQPGWHVCGEASNGAEGVSAADGVASTY
jgi:chemotaxis response regulator CheB